MRIIFGIRDKIVHTSLTKILLLRLNRGTARIPIRGLFCALITYGWCHDEFDSMGCVVLVNNGSVNNLPN